MSDEVDAPTVTFVFPSNVSADRIIEWPCTISKPVNGGGIVKETIMARFKLLDRDRVAEITNPFDTAVRDPNKTLLTEALVGVVDMPLEGGGTVSNEVAIPFCLRTDFIVDGLVRGYARMAHGLLPKN